MYGYAKTFSQIYILGYTHVLPNCSYEYQISCFSEIQTNVKPMCESV